jgi:aconitase A
MPRIHHHRLYLAGKECGTESSRDWTAKGTVMYYENGGILPYVLRSLVGKKP